MTLCLACQRLDFRALFQAAKDRADLRADSFAHNRCMLSDEEYHSRVIPKCVESCASLADLKVQAERGCQLCTLIWQAWASAREQRDAPLPTDEDLRTDAEFGGRIYLGGYLPDDFAEGTPLVFVDRHNCARVHDFFCVEYICNLEAFPNRSEFFRSI
jgi:hypothetical protein